MTHFCISEIGHHLVQIMACRLTCSLSEPMLIYCQLEPKEQTSVTFGSNLKHFHLGKGIWKCLLENGGHFVSASMWQHIEDESAWPSFCGQFQMAHLPSNLWYKCTKSQNLIFLISSCSCLCLIHWTQVLSQEWRCSWSTTNRQFSNYIWVTNNFIAY